MAKLSPMTIIPPLIFAAIAGMFLYGLLSDRARNLPSTLVGQLAPVPPTEGLPGQPLLEIEMLRDGQVKIVNFWASWCPPCRAEHASLMEIAATGIPVYGINKSDQVYNALAFLEELGNPYSAIAVDSSGRQSLDWGVAALPETFILDGDGRVVLKFSGPIQGVMDTIIWPTLELAAN